MGLIPRNGLLAFDRKPRRPYFPIMVEGKVEGTMKKSRNGKPMRFAALIRVSTEKQAARGESLRTQKKQIVEAVANLGGEIAREYSGQEHATEGSERKLFDSLLADAGKDRKAFDAVIVADVSRWSRDEMTNSAGLTILRNHGIRFFTLNTEYDLHDENQWAILTVFSAMNKLSTSIRMRKVMTNCIERAKRGIPTGGSIPYGRTYDRKTNEWGIDVEIKKKMQDFAERYLKGASMRAMARECGVTQAFLHKTLTRRSGGVHRITWNSAKLNISEAVEMKMPRLLSEKMIKAVNEKAEANRKYQHGQFRKNGEKSPYLLSGYVFCAECKYTITGAKDKKDQRFYRHNYSGRARDCTTTPKPRMRCEELENAVLIQLFETFGNEKAVRRSIENAIPNNEKISRARKRTAQIGNELAKIEKGRNRILKQILDDKITDDQAAALFDDLKERETVLHDERESLENSLQDIPSREAIDKVVERIFQNKLTIIATKKGKDGRQYTSANVWARQEGLNDEFDTMTDDDKRSLLAQVFGGKRRDGKPCGVYVEPVNDGSCASQRRWKFTLHGLAPIDGFEGVTQYSSF